MIFIDASRYSNTENRTGVENYSFHLINELIRAHANGITLIAPKKIDLSVPQIVIPFPKLWTQLRLSWEILKNKKICNLFVPSHVLPFIHPKQSVITIHDVAFCRFPESYGFFSRQYLKWSTRFAVKHAAKIIVPSHATRGDLVKFFGAAPDKIVVIPHGHAVYSVETRDLAFLQNYGIAPKKYFLYIGRIETKKNLCVLIDAFKKINAELPEYKLVLAGKDGVGAKAIHAAAKECQDILFAGYIDEQAKSALLENAVAFVFPSLYEGFGFPLLEAMEYGLPIIASDISASRELADDAAFFFDPNDPDALEQQLKEIISPLRKGSVPSTRDEGVRRTEQKQKTILSTHTWEQCAEKTWKAITC